MPSPYQTNCFHYKNVGCKSRNDCIEKCNIELAKEQCNSLPLNINMDISHANHIYNYSNYQCLKMFNYSICKNKFKSHHCINEYYRFAINDDIHFNFQIQN